MSNLIEISYQLAALAMNRIENEITATPFEEQAGSLFHLTYEQSF